jgi:hypothetical protein
MDKKRDWAQLAEPKQNEVGSKFFTEFAHFSELENSHICVKYSLGN